MARPTVERSKPLGMVRSRPERLDVARLLQRDLVDRVVLQDARRGTSRCLRLRLAPGGKRLQDGELARLLHPHLEALPGILRVRAVGLDVRQDRHLLVDPGGAALLGELRRQRQIDVAQMRHVGDRVVDLLAP